MIRGQINLFAPMPTISTPDFEAAIDAVIERVGKTIVLGIPLGLGKPAGFTNALYHRAKADPSLSLVIFTALSLNRPRASGVGGALVNPVLDMAKKADIAVFGIGSVLEADSTYLSLTDAIGREALELARPAGEVLAHLVTETGELCDHPTNRRLVALTLEELAGIPNRIAIASGSQKVAPIAAVLSGGLASNLITDERTATAVVAMMKGRKDAVEA